MVVIMGLKSTALKLIERYHNTPELLSLPVKNDLDTWRIRRSNDDWEDGLHTGETVLHIAIVQEDVEFVHYLLERGASLVSRASGTFFQPKMIPLRAASRHAQCEDDDGDVDYLRFFSRPNEDSACYYGEYPLSFCASVGNCALLDAVYGEMQRRLAARPPAAEPRDGVIPHGAPLLGSRSRLGSKGSKKLSNRALDFQLLRESDVAEAGQLLRATDALGNTALHLAALHERTDAIDWLMGKDEDGYLLEALNLDGLTPFTLAVRYGKVEVYRHILYNYLSKTAWVYGRVRMRKTDLLQVQPPPPHLLPKCPAFLVRAPQELKRWALKGSQWSNFMGGGRGGGGVGGVGRWTRTGWTACACTRAGPGAARWSWWWRWSWTPLRTTRCSTSW